MLRVLRRVCPLGVFTTLLSCTAPAEDSAGAARPGVAAAPAAIAPVAASPASGEWAINDFGIGRLRAGMSVSEARAILPRFTVPEGAEGSGCSYAATGGLPAGVLVMVNDGRIGRIDVQSGKLATAAGARIGDSEDRIATLYGQRMRVSPHKYTSGHYLTVQPAAARDSAFRTVFETDGKRVLRYRVGVRPPVEYVEGCS